MFAPHRSRIRWLFVCFLCLACTPLAQFENTITQTPLLNPESVEPQEPTLTVEVSATPTSIPTVWLSPSLPMPLATSLENITSRQLIQDSTSADVLIQPGTEGETIGEWRYFLAVPFFCLQDSITTREFLQAWSTIMVNEEDSPITIGMSGTTLAMLTTTLGEPRGQVQIINDVADLHNAVWQDTTCRHWAILPFEEVTWQWKLIRIDDQDPFTEAQSLLRVPISAAPKNLTNIPAITNFHPEKITTVNMTGVTALVRATAVLMEKHGVLYPAEDVGDILRSADFTHISNEVSFAVDCPYPQYVMEGLTFCSAPEYISLLEAVGADIIEMTGDHLHDWGNQALMDTLTLYEQRQFLVYGAGYNIEQAMQPLRIEHNGNRLAFIGCNAKSPGYAQSSANSPGTWFCDWETLSAQIQSVTDEGYLPIITIQHKEYDQPTPTQEIITDFHFLADQGAAVIIGSQAHQPQTFDFSTPAFIHYGLGNLFFDQYNEGANYRDAFIDRLTVYENHLVNVSLTTTVFIDWAKPRLMDETERINFLNRIYQLSDWGIPQP
ncbi:MAG: CapA family protein [Anaerolineae bacterium]|nr:CapA family protein [Anaerolineae bacterium]